MNGLKAILYAWLALIAIKIVSKLLGNIEKMLLKDIRRNKLRYGLVISRKDLADVQSSVRIKNRLLYTLAVRNNLLMQCIPYRRLFDDTTSKEGDEFLHWCRKFLEDLGYSNFSYEYDSVKVAKDMTCYKEEELVYVQCRLLKLEPGTPVSKEDYWPKLGRADVQTFVGAMVSDGVTRGVLITTGDFTEEAYTYAETISQRFHVQLIDGYTVTKTVRKMREPLSL